MCSLSVTKTKNCELVGLIRPARRDCGVYRCLNDELKKLIEGLALEKPPNSIAHIHRSVRDYCKCQQQATPSYSTVYGIIGDLDLGLVTLAHGQHR
jgi:putative transposase